MSEAEKVGREVYEPTGGGWAASRRWDGEAGSSVAGGMQGPANVCYACQLSNTSHSNGIRYNEDHTLTCSLLWILPSLDGELYIVCDHGMYLPH